MIRQFFNSIVLLTFLNYTMGCAVTSHETATAEDVILQKEKITQIVKKDGVLVEFNARGATYLGRVQGMEAIDSTIFPRLVAMERIAELRFDRPLPIKQLKPSDSGVAEVTLHNGMHVVFDEKGGTYRSDRGLIVGRTIAADTFTYPISKMKFIRLQKTQGVPSAEFLQASDAVAYEVITLDGRAVDFGPLGGKSVDKEVFRGTDLQGKVVDVPCDDVLSATIERVDEGATVAATFVGAMGIAGISYLIYLALAYGRF